VKNSLYPVFKQDGMAEIMDIAYVPFGNSQINMNEMKATCQHGEAECYANSYEQCAIDIYPDQVRTDGGVVSTVTALVPALAIFVCPTVTPC
jgi:hypothetical protein